MCWAGSSTLATGIFHSERGCKEQAADKTVADTAFVLELLVKNALDAREFKQFAASNRALELLGKERGMFKDGIRHEMEITPPAKPYADMTQEERDVERQRLMALEY